MSSLDPKLLFEKGQAAYEKGDFSAAQPDLEEALDLFLKDGDLSSAVAPGMLLGHIASIQDSPSIALERFHQVLDLTRKTKNQLQETAALYNIGQVYAHTGEPGKALDWYEQSLVILRAMDDKDDEAIVLADLAEAYRGIDKPREAIKHYERALRIHRQSGKKEREANVLLKLGTTYVDLGETRKAIELFEQALEIDRRLNDEGSAAYILYQMSTAYTRLGDREKAVQLAEESLALYRKLEDGPAISMVESTLEELQKKPGDPDVERVRRQLADRADEWVKGGRNSDRLMDSKDLEEVKASHDPSSLTEHEVEYIAASERALLQAELEAGLANKGQKQSKVTSETRPATPTIQENILSALSESSRKAIRIAENLRRQVQPEGSQLSTEHLLIGLNELPEEAASALFSAFGQDSAGIVKGLKDIQKWQIPPDLTYQEAPIGDGELGFLPYSTHAVHVLEEAWHIAGEKQGADFQRFSDVITDAPRRGRTGKAAITIGPRHLLQALLKDEGTASHTWMAGAGIPIAQVYQTLMRTPGIQKITPAMFAFAPGVASADLTAEEDTLGFKPYAQALAEIIIKKETVPPVVFGIYGPWGSGKSTFMSFVRKYLEEWDSGYRKPQPARKNEPYPNLMKRISNTLGRFAAAIKRFLNAGKRKSSALVKRSWSALVRFIQGDPGIPETDHPNLDVPKILCVSFDAWAYTDSNRLWVGLVQTISQKLDEQINWWMRPIYWLRRTSWQFLGAVLLSLLPMIVGILIALVLPLWGSVQNLEAVRLLIGFLGSLGSFRLVNNQKPLSDIVQRELNKLDRTEVDGVINRIQKQIHSTVENYFKLSEAEPDAQANPQDTVRRQKKLKLVVFIDELDRCPLEKIVDILESIKLFLAEDIFIVLMAVDTRVAAEAIRLHYKEVENPDLAHEYLEKIIQVPIPVPAAKRDHLTTYIDSMMSVKKKDKETGKGPDPGRDIVPGRSSSPASGLRPAPIQSRPRIQVSPEPFKPFNLEDTLEEQEAILLFGEKHLAGNPRRIKRLLNTYRYVKILATRQGEQTHRAEWQTGTILWLGATMSWPLFMERAILSIQALPLTENEPCVESAFWQDLAKDVEQDNCPPEEIYALLPKEIAHLESLSSLADNFIKENPPRPRGKEKEEAPKHNTQHPAEQR